MEYKACVFSMYASRNSGPPAWIVFLAGVALIFGLYYVWLGVRDFLANGPAPLNATQQAEQQLTAAFEQAANQSVLPTSRPTLTPQPTCQRYTVRVEEVNVRTGPDVAADFIEKRTFGTEICVIGLEGDTTWFLIDMDPESRRIDPGYIRSDLLEAANPSPTPSITEPPAPTITLTPSNTPTATPTVTDTPTRTPRPRATSTG